MTNRLGLAAGAAALISFGLATAANARGTVLDGSIDICSVEVFYGDIPSNGAVEVALGTFNADDGINQFGTTCDALTHPNTTFNPFSVNIGGTLYDKMFVHENGILTFGAPIAADPSTPLFTLAVPAIAPFFANGLLPANGSLEFGWSGADTYWLTWFGLEEEGGVAGVRNRFQVAIKSLGGGDFDLIFNYDLIEWDPGQAGFTDGAGGGFLFPGAGIAGGYLGDDNPLTPLDCSPTSLACNLFNDGTGPGSIDFENNLRTGYYKYEFRNGILTPIPAAAWIFGAGFVALLGAARRRKPESRT